jgi:hypothetical protein
MNRRSLLRRTGALGAVLLAGCTGPDGIGADGGDGDGTTTESPTDTPTETPDPVTVVDETIRTTASRCRSTETAETATVGVDRERNQVTITGALQTSNPCYRAVLETARYDAETGTLHLGVRAASTDEVCIACVGTVEYEATVTLSGGVPDAVEIVHDGQVVTTEPGDASADASDTGDGGEGTSDGDATTVLTAANLEVIGRGPVDEADPAPGDIEFRSDGSEIVITGLVRARNGCETVIVDALGYDSTTDTLTADVVAEVPPGNEDKVCTQALSNIEYRLTVGFENGMPHAVEVTQDGHGGMGAGYSEATASTPA